MVDTVPSMTQKFKDAARSGDTDAIRALVAQSTSKHVLRDDLHDARVHALLGKHKELADELRLGTYRISRHLCPSEYSKDPKDVDVTNVAKYDYKPTDSELLLEHVIECQSYAQVKECVDAGLDVEEAFLQATRRMDDHVDLIEWLASFVSRESIQHCYQKAIARKNDLVRGIMIRFGAKALRPSDTRRANQILRERDSHRDFWRRSGFDEPPSTSACS